MKEGWHKDPDDPSQERWWDGESWGKTRKISRKDSLQEAGRRSSKQDIRPRRRRRGGSPSGNSSENPPVSSSPDNAPSTPSDPEPPSFSKKPPRKERGEERPSFVELPSAREGSPRGKDFHEEDDLWSERDSNFNDFEDLEELSSGTVAFESFEEIARKESPQEKTPEEGIETPEREEAPKKKPTSSPKKLLTSSLRSLRKGAERRKTQKKTKKKTPKETSPSAKASPARGKGRRGDSTPGKKSERERSRIFSGNSPGATAAKKMLPVGVGIILVVAAAAILPGMLEGDPAPPKTLQDRLETRLAEKRKDNRKPYPGVEKCLRQNSSVNSVLQKPNDAGELEWKAIFIDQSKNYQIVTVTRKPSPAEATQNARLTASTFITTSSGPYYIQGPIKGIAGSSSSKQLSAYVATLARCLAKT